jgi:glucosyl-3-phosphoglycerate synthase
LVLPSLYSEVDGPALRPIVEELQHVPYLNEVVVSLDGADSAQFVKAREFFSVCLIGIESSGTTGLDPGLVP